MSTAPATATSHHPTTGSRIRNLLIGASFSAVLLLPKILRIRNSPSSWLTFRISLGLAGAALVVLPLSIWNNWIGAPIGLGMFLASILLPPAKLNAHPDEKARELGALIVVNGGTYKSADLPSVPVQLFVGADKIWALDARFKTLLAIPVVELSSANVIQTKYRWTLQLRWSSHSADFSYRGVFAEHLARVAQTTVSTVMHSPLPILQKTRAAGA
jgi:hypothetical protein